MKDDRETVHLDAVPHVGIRYLMPSSDPVQTIGVLAVQGSFDLHLESLRRGGVEGREVRSPDDLAGLDGLIIPGGESTVMAGVTEESGLYEEIRAAATTGLPILGTCAGAILLGEGDEAPVRLGVVPVVVERNAYGRQIESFERDLSLEPFEEPFRAIFIRAPQIRLPSRHAQKGIEVLGRDGEYPVLVRYRHILIATFHPELTDDTRMHRYFVEEICRRVWTGSSHC